MNLVSTYMDQNPIYCTRDTRIAEIKYLLQKYDWNEIFVLDSAESKLPIGIVGFEDVNTYEIEQSDIPSDVSAEECMRTIPAVVHQDSSLEECLNIMRLNHIDRLPVVDGNGHMEGMIDRDAIVKIIM